MTHVFIFTSVGRVDALKVCLEEKLDDVKSSEKIKIQTEHHNDNKR